MGAYGSVDAIMGSKEAKKKRRKEEKTAKKKSDIPKGIVSPWLHL